MQCNSDPLSALVANSHNRTAIPYPPVQWINEIDFVVFHMLLCMLQQGEALHLDLLTQSFHLLLFFFGYHDNFIAKDSMQCNSDPLSALAVDKHNRLRCLSHAFVHDAAG